MLNSPASSSSANHERASGTPPPVWASVGTVPVLVVVVRVAVLVLLVVSVAPHPPPGELMTLLSSVTAPLRARPDPE